MAKASKSGSAPTQQVPPDSANASFFFDASALAALLGGSANAAAGDTQKLLDDLSLLLVQRNGGDLAPIASVPVDQQLLEELLQGATLDFVDLPSANAGDGEAAGSDRGQVLVFETANGFPNLSHYFEAGMPIPVALDSDIMERLDALEPALPDGLIRVLATSDVRDPLVVLIMDMPHDLPPPAPSEFG